MVIEATFQNETWISTSHLIHLLIHTYNSYKHTIQKRKYFSENYKKIFMIKWWAYKAHNS